MSIRFDTCTGIGWVDRQMDQLVKLQAVREATTICPAPCKLSFDLESGVRVTCDVGYLCVNFSLSRPLCSRLRPDIRDRQTSDVHHCLMPPTVGAGAYIAHSIRLRSGELG